jgi:hypothetical protein
VRGIILARISERDLSDEGGDVSSRRLEDRIRELSRKALTAKDSELEAVFAELRTALHQHIERIRRFATMKLEGKVRS